jgi:hypothetical protein
MKSVHAIKSHLLQITAISRVLARLRVSDDLKKRAMTDVVFFVSGRHGAKLILVLGLLSFAMLTSGPASAQVQHRTVRQRYRLTCGRELVRQPELA